MFDVDSDGRPDIVQVTSSTTALVYFNLGGQFFSTGSPYPIGATGVKGILRTITGRDSTADIPSDYPENRTWQLNSDLMDLDGDGIAEPGSINESSQLVRGVRPSLGPPRLLTLIDNGRGARSTITYASSRTPA